MAERRITLTLIRPATVRLGEPCASQFVVPLNVPLDRISGRNDLLRALCHRARAFVDCPEHPLAAVDRRLERRRLRPGLVRRASRARSVSRNAPRLVRRKSPLSLPPSALASVLRPCARGNRHGRDAAE